jgi:hypothetical protein
MAKEKSVIQQIKERKWKWIGHTFRKFSVETLRDDIREEDHEKNLEENSIGRYLKSGKDLARSWSLGPKWDPLEMLHGSPMLLKG